MWILFLHFSQCYNTQKIEFPISSQIELLCSLFNQIQTYTIQPALNTLTIINFLMSAKCDSHSYHLHCTVILSQFFTLVQLQGLFLIRSILEY